MLEPRVSVTATRQTSTNDFSLGANLELVEEETIIFADALLSVW